MQLNNPFESDNPWIFLPATIMVIAAGFCTLFGIIWAYVALGISPPLAFALSIPTICAPRVIYYVFKGK